MGIFNRKKLLVAVFAVALIFTSLCSIQPVHAETKYYLGGVAAGFVLDGEGAFVLSVVDVITEEGTFSPSANAGIREGDVILSLNGQRIDDVYQIESVLKGCNGNKITAVIRRGDTEIIKDIQPAKDLNGKYKLGLIIRDAITGIGTITYFTQDKKFVALGHPISDEQNVTTGVTKGYIYNCSIIGVAKGKKGTAGELKGIFSENEHIGRVMLSTKTGIEGEVYSDSLFGQAVEIGKGRQGKAKIYSCVDGEKAVAYDISIVKCDYGNKSNKNFVIKVTDKKLISITGGIVQGMSGSPIVQNGKLIGAVTHVFLNDPSRGYGIAIENMIKE